MNNLNLKISKSTGFLFIILATMMFMTSCSKHPCVGEWEGQINRNQYIKLSVQRDGKYRLQLIQNNERYDCIYKGEWKQVSDNTIEMPSDMYEMNYVRNRRPDDPGSAFCNIHRIFYLKENGELWDDKFPNTDWYLHRVDDN